MTDADRIKHLELVLGTLISWLPGVFATNQCQRLLSMLTREEETPSQPDA